MRYIPQVPVLHVGPPGAGKTASVLASFEHTEVVLTSSMVEEDVAGLPYRDGQYDLRTIPGLFRRLNAAADAGKTTCLFLDELDKARRSVADTLLTLIVSRRVGDATLPQSTCIIGAANPPEWGGGDGVSDAMVARFSIVDFVPDVAAWAKWALTRYDEPACQRVVQAIANGEIPLIERTGDDFSRRITSPRTLTMALDLVQEFPRDVPHSLVQGLVTAATASQIMHLVTVTPNDVMATATRSARRGLNTQGRAPLRVGE